jgi:hypothetical protein
VYWFTKAGGDTYFGNVEEVAYADAQRLFRQHITSLAEATNHDKRKVLTAGELMDLFLDWVQAHRSDRSYSTHRTHCTRFGAFTVGGKKIADLPADKVKGADLEAWLTKLEQGQSAQTRRYPKTSIKHAWNWGTKHPSPTPYLPATFRPFSSGSAVRNAGRFCGLGAREEPIVVPPGPRRERSGVHPGGKIVAPAPAPE